MKMARTLKNILTVKRLGIAAWFHMVVLAVVLAPSTCGAHEFWLEPVDFMPPTGKILQVKAKVGQNFEGESLVFLQKDFPSVVKFSGRRPVRLTGTDGASPALDIFIRERGPQLIALRSRVYELEFTRKEKFTEYLDLEGYSELARRAAAALRNPIEIWEEYERNAKLLVFGDGRRDGRDHRTGLDLEFVIQDNFDRLKRGNRISVKLLKGGDPLPNTPVKVLRLLNREASLFLETDRRGEIALNLDIGGPWLLNAVHFRKMYVAPAGEVKSVWASYVFFVD